MYGSDVAILITYGSHLVRHVDFCGLTVVNETPEFGASHLRRFYEVLPVGTRLAES